MLELIVLKLQEVILRPAARYYFFQAGFRIGPYEHIFPVLRVMQVKQHRATRKVDVVKGTDKFFFIYCV